MLTIGICRISRNIFSRLQLYIESNQLIHLSGGNRHHHCHLKSSELKSRSLIRLSGPDTISYLQGLITNDINKLNEQKSIFAFFLNQQGRILYDTLIYRRNPESYIVIECDTTVQKSLLRHLQLYRIRRNVQIEDVSQELKVWVLWDSSNPSICSNLRSIKASSLCEAETEASQADRNKTILEGLEVYPDPRLDLLGWRFIGSTEQTKIETEEKEQLDKVEEQHYKALLYSLGIGEGSIDYPIGNSFPLESNGDLINGINFHKGCYIGQELTARTHYTGVVRKRLMPFRLPVDAQIQSEVDKSTLQLINQNKKSIAKVRNIIQTYGLALTRIEEANKSTEVRLGDYPVKLEKPCWWPIDLSIETNQAK